MLSIFVLFGLFSTQAVAASFDCNKATTWLEKTVCSNPELSKLDDQMAKAYHDALTSLSPEGQKETKECQRQWLEEIPNIKAKYDKFYAENKEYPARYHDEDITTSLKGAYEKRVKQLQESLVIFPDRIFRNVYIAHTKSDKTCPYVYVTKYLTFAQIENPRDENEKIWDNFISKIAIHNFKEYDVCQEMDHTYAVSFSNKHLISFQGQLFWYTQGLPHGLAQRASFNWLLEDKRELQASDLFNDKTDWRNKLTALVAERVKEKEAADKTMYKIGPDGLMDMVTSPSEWEISKEGLGFRFVEIYWRGPSALITIDWKTLDPFLSKIGRSLIYD